MLAKRLLIVLPALWPLCVAPAAAGTPASSAAGQPRQLIVHFDEDGKLLRSLQGVDGGPLPIFDKPWPPSRRQGVLRLEPADVRQDYRDARIDLVRTHDSFGAGDIDSKFPAYVPDDRSALSIFPDMNADPEESKSYNFGPTDKLIKSIEDIGADIIFRIGRSANAQADPPDPDKYAAIARHVVLHYNRGWAHGFQYGIRYWEVWNEPDLGKIFWSGTPEQYYTLYGKVATAVKTADPSAKVGGPALSDSWKPDSYREGFLNYVHAHDLPLDFFSWHHYSVDADDAYDMTYIGGEIRLVLDRAGFPNAESILDEWNYGILGKDLDASVIQRAAFVASAILYMQDAPIDRSTLYRGDQNFGLHGGEPDKVGQVLIALGRMKDTPYRLAASGGNLNGFALQAGRNKDGSKIQILISNYEIPPENRGLRVTSDNADYSKMLSRRDVRYGMNAGYSLAIENLPAGLYHVKRYRISGDHNSDVVWNYDASPPVFLSSDLAAPGVELVEVDKKPG